MVKIKKCETLIELIMTMLIVSIVAAVVAGAMIFFVQLFIYSPRQLDCQKIAQEISNLMIEGTPDARGLRYTRSIIDASSTQFSYSYGYPAVVLSVRFRWDSGDGHIYRSISTNSGGSWSAESVVPYYIPTELTIDGKDTTGVIFSYKKASDADWVLGVDALTDIRRVIISITVKTATGNFDDFQGSVDLTQSVEIKSF
ncbi:MAG: hypothetical protein K9L86_05155 [Candidatus Omnitrophica bacterium]|nr:hypothetical protein [Candidatus Omnitrophota bacterium]